MKKETKKKENIKENKKIEKKEKKKIFASFLTANYEDFRKIAYPFVAGVLITVLIVILIWPKRIAKLKNGEEPIFTIDKVTYTADNLYTDMKSLYGAKELINNIDKIILDKMYPETDEMNNEVNNNAEYYFKMYEQYYGQSEQEFLANNGFSSKNEFLDQLKLDYRRNLYYDEYAKKLVTDKDIEKYYDKEVVGDIDTKHILVAIDEEKGLKDSEAKELAKEIIKKLNDGKKWEEVTEEYKDKITTEELGYQAFNASLEEAYVKEMRSLKKDTYSTTPVLTSYGYHIVYKIDEKEKPKLEDIKDEVIEALAKEKKDADQNLYQKSLISLREEKGLTFKDTDLGSKYETYTKNYK